MTKPTEPIIDPQDALVEEVARGEHWHNRLTCAIAHETDPARRSALKQMLEDNGRILADARKALVDTATPLRRMNRPGRFRPLETPK